MSVKLNVRGVMREQLHRFTYTRALIDYDDAVVFVDFVAGRWDLSADPATPEEMPTLEKLMADQMDRTVVKEIP